MWLGNLPHTQKDLGLNLGCISPDLLRPSLIQVILDENLSVLRHFEKLDIKGEAGIIFHPNKSNENMYPSCNGTVSDHKNVSSLKISSGIT